MSKKISISAEITGLSYKPLLCRDLRSYRLEELEAAINRDATFQLVFDDKEFSISWWVSPKRTRSYPYARVYDSLDFSGKRITIIPIIKDEGKRGDRDYLQWDTLSLMSLLGIYVIISYYKEASKNKKYENKITNQRFDIEQIKLELYKLAKYQSDPLHWNVSQVDNLKDLGHRAIEAYENISQTLGVDMHDLHYARKRIEEIAQSRESFTSLSRDLARQAQSRERVTEQPKEFIDGNKAEITIKNWLGGHYFWTCDEVEIENKTLCLIEGKHTKTNNLPSIGDIKDGLIKMYLYTNITNVKIGDKSYKTIPVLKLTTGEGFDKNKLSKIMKRRLNNLLKEAELNGFRVLLNNNFIK